MAESVLYYSKGGGSMKSAKRRIENTVNAYIKNVTIPVPEEIINATNIKLFFNNSKIPEIEARLERIAIEKRRVYGQQLETLQKEYWRLKSDLNGLYTMYPEYSMVNI